MTDTPTMEQAVIAALLANDAVTAHAGRRVYPLIRPQDSAMPALVFTTISSQPDATHDGATGLSESRIQLDAYAATYAAAKGLARAVRGVLHQFAGDVEVDGGTVTLQGVFQDGERDLFEGEAPERIFRVSLDFNVWAVEPTS